MRIDVNEIEASRPEDREVALLAAEVRRLQNIIAVYTDGISPDAKSKPALTDEEREAIEFFAAIHNEGYGLFATHTDTLRNLLERLT
jgi:hypothetical protein